MKLTSHSLMLLGVEHAADIPKLRSTIPRDFVRIAHTLWDLVGREKPPSVVNLRLVTRHSLIVPLVHAVAACTPYHTIYARKDAAYDAASAARRCFVWVWRLEREMREPREVARAHNSAGGRERYGLTRLLDNISKGAFHDAAERGDTPKCHPHTRVAIRSEIMEWISAWISAPDARRKFIIWMYGPAGSGKTAIGQSIAEECKRRGLHAASFFFSRTAAGRNDTTRVVATIAYQISRFLPQFEDAMLTAIERDPAIFDRIPGTQMQTLVIKPLKALPPSSQPIFVLLDGLDEAGPTAQDQANLLNVIGTATTALWHIPLIFLIASRPEYEIREAFNGQLNPLMQSLVLDHNYKPDDDIRLYLTSTFAEIRDKHIRSGTRPRLPCPWPSESDIDHLVSKASGQFIFAATVLKFVDSIRHHPAERLDVIFSLLAGGHASEAPFASLDALYHYILSSVAEPAKVQQILTLLVLISDSDERLEVEEIEQFLDLDVRRVLVDMHALVLVPPPVKFAELEFHHASLYDFLMDRSRSHDFYIDASQGHIDLTLRWWKVIFNNNNQYSTQLGLLTRLRNFVHHFSKSPATSIELADDFACFNLKQLLEEHCGSGDLLDPPWNTFFECVKQQTGDRKDISRRMKAEFDAFFMDCIAKYPPALQTYIPTILVLQPHEDAITDIIHLLLCGFIESLTEYDNFCELDSMLLSLGDADHIFNDGNAVFSTLFQDECLAGEYYVCDRSYLALANQIIGIIFPKPGEDNRQIKFEKARHAPNKQVLYLEDGSLHLRLYNLDFSWFWYMLRGTPQDLDLATLLRERALQYDGRDTVLEGKLGYSSLEYIQRCGIQYLKHVHPPGTDECIICKRYEYTSVVVDLDWRNDPQADAAAFVLDEVNRTPSPTLSSDLEGSSFAEPPKKLKRKRESQSPPAKLGRRQRLND
ncbi:hypothetical protein BJ912DRAFT_1141413 [Pholiota molesta]|nr:hypothetical protein BJ912DRAFT_1141413 [Pholiota molesta]